MSFTFNASPGLLRGGPLLLGVEVSVIRSESHRLRAEPTVFALESGAEASDHVIVRPAEVSVHFAVTNTGDGLSAARDAFETFKKMLEGRELVELITEHHVYDNMVITGLSPRHEAPFKGAFTATLHLRQISFVRLESAGRTALEPGSRTAKTAAPESNAGCVDARSVDVGQWL